MPWLTGVGNVTTSTVNYYHPHYCGERKPEMIGLYEAWIVDPDKQLIAWSSTGKGAFLARDDEIAKLKAVQAATEEKLLVLDIEDYDIVVRRVGDVRTPEGE
jgi:hypothetical protein